MSARDLMSIRFADASVSADYSPPLRVQVEALTTAAAYTPLGAESYSCEPYRVYKMSQSQVCLNVTMLMPAQWLIMMHSSLQDVLALLREQFVLTEGELADDVRL